MLIGLIYLSGVYLFFNIPESQIKRNKSINSNSLEGEGEEEKKSKEKFSFLTVMSYAECALLVCCIMVELNTTDFFTPTLVNYLNDSFSLSTSKASFFFLASTFGYIICTQMINKLTDLCNNFKLIFIGHIMGSFCCLLTAPMGILPHNYIIILNHF